MVFVLRKSCTLYKKVARSLFQGPTFTNKIMGASNSRSYSPKNNQSNIAGGDSVTGRGSITRMESSPNEFIEAVVCHQDDLKDNEMKVFNVGEDGKVLVVKQKGEFFGVGTKCSHYGAPLVNGALGDGRIRCQWHGACFSLRTGDIEDFPGFDSLPCYNVSVTPQGQVKVRARISDLKSNIRTKDMASQSFCDVSAVVIIGGGPSGATCAETLRAEGFRGRITLVCKEKHLPYDRIKVSKMGTLFDVEKIQVRTDEYYKNANIEVFQGVEATNIDNKQKFVHLSSGAKIQYSAVYIATGCKARWADVPGNHHKNVFTVRNYDDSVHILDALGENSDKNVVVLGLSFIGLEAAATFLGKAQSMTVVGNDSVPLQKVFGLEIGQRLQKMYEEKGVNFRFNTTIAEVIGDIHGVVTGVRLADDTELPADVVIFGVGSTYHTEFLKHGSEIDLQHDGTVTVNNFLETNIKNVYAGGDIAYAPVFAANNAPMSIGHIGLAQYHGRVAALNILRRPTSLRTVPYFWTMLFGKSIRYAGCGVPESTQLVGDLEEMKFVLYSFDKADKVISVASCTMDPIVSQFAELVYQGKTLTKQELQEDAFAWTEKIKPVILPPVETYEE